MPFGFLSDVEAAAADEFPDDGVLRDQLRADREEVVEELEEALRLLILRLVRLDLEQERCREELQYRQLIDHAGVHHHIRGFLVREDVLILSPAYAVPHGDGVLRAVAAGAVVAHDAAEEAAIRRRYAVVVVDIDLGQGGDIDLEAGIRRKFLRHLVVQAVDAFDDEDVVLTELTEVAAVLALSGDEVVDRQLHRLAREEL